jgi:hypothetical protein
MNVLGDKVRIEVTEAKTKKEARLSWNCRNNVNGTGIWCLLGFQGKSLFRRNSRALFNAPTLRSTKMEQERNASWNHPSATT